MTVLFGCWQMLQNVSGIDLGNLDSRLTQFSETVAEAEKSGDAVALGDLVIQWRDSVSPMMNELGRFFDDAAVRMSTDIKTYRAKADDGSLSDKTAELYRKLALRAQESLKNLMVYKGQMAVLTEKLEKTMNAIMERTEVKELIEMHDMQRRLETGMKKVEAGYRALNLQNKIVR
jgi:hypothetical protein